MRAFVLQLPVELAFLNSVVRLAYFLILEQLVERLAVLLLLRVQSSFQPQYHAIYAFDIRALAPRDVTARVSTI